VPGQERQQGQAAAGLQIVPARRDDSAVGVNRAQLDASARPRVHFDVRAEADGRVHRGGAVVKKVQRPDVDRPAGEIDACRSRRRQTHAALYEV
jgi:hypothetical protein